MIEIRVLVIKWEWVGENTIGEQYRPTPLEDTQVAVQTGDEPEWEGLSIALRDYALGKLDSEDGRFPDE